MGVPLGWLFWLFLKTEGGEKDQPPAQSPGPATLKQTEEEVDHLFEVFRAMAARAGIALPRAGGSFLPAKPGAGQEEQCVVPGRGSAGPPSSCPCGEGGRGPGCHCSALGETLAEVMVRTNPPRLGGFGGSGFHAEAPWYRETSERFAFLMFCFYTETAAMLPLPPRCIDKRMNHTLSAEIWNRLLARRRYFVSFLPVLPF